MNPAMPEALDALQNNLTQRLEKLDSNIVLYRSEEDDKLKQHTNELKSDLQKNHEETLARCMATDQRVDDLSARLEKVEDIQAESAYLFQDDFLAKKLELYDRRLDELEWAEN